LKSENIKFLKAKDGIDALMILKEEDIHLVLMDIMMPRMDGIKTTFKIRENKTFLL
jgi:CheY-like chemotaxis protein